MNLAQSNSQKLGAIDAMTAPMVMSDVRNINIFLGRYLCISINEKAPAHTPKA